jgi:hypothetical protein
MMYEYFTYAYEVIGGLFAGRFLISNSTHFGFILC